MNALMHKLNGYTGWEKYVDQISMAGWASRNRSYIVCEIFYDRATGFFWDKSIVKVSTSFEVEVDVYRDKFDVDELKGLASAAREAGNKWKQEILEYVNREDADERKAMIEMAEMALGSSDPNVKDHFLTKWLASVKPIKDEKK